MKKGDVQKLAKKTVVDLRKDLDSAKEELRTLRFDLATGKTKNIIRVKEIRKKIARIMTFMKQKEQEQKEDGKDN